VALEYWSGWLWVEFGFTLFFCTEMVLRISWAGIKDHFLGEDWAWSSFDAVIVGIAVVDTIISFTVQSSDAMSTMSLLRLTRLTRLTRLVRIFRLRALRELTKMVTGLVAGFKTLFWATTLLGFWVAFLKMCFGPEIGCFNQKQILLRKWTP